jgi:hypothetical protein
VRLIVRRYTGGPFDRSHEPVPPSPRPATVDLWTRDPDGTPIRHRYEIQTVDPDAVTYRYVGSLAGTTETGA